MYTACLGIHLVLLMIGLFGLLACKKITDILIAVQCLCIAACLNFTLGTMLKPGAVNVGSVGIIMVISISGIIIAVGLLGSMIVFRHMNVMHIDEPTDDIQIENDEL